MVKNTYFLRQVYQGYIDDPRNTDNAWIETLAYNFHDETSEVTRDFKLNVSAAIFIHIHIVCGYGKHSLFVGGGVI